MLRRQPDAVLPRQVRAQPRPALGAERLLLGVGVRSIEVPIVRLTDTCQVPSRSVDFDLDADQVALRDAARRAARRPRIVGAGARGRRRPDGDRVDAELWKAMVDQGWPAIAVPEDAGGVGLGWVEAAVLLEQVGAHVAPAPILGTLVALDALGGRRVRPSRCSSAPSWAAVASSGRREVVPYAAAARRASWPCAGDELVRRSSRRPPSRPPPWTAPAGMAWLDPAPLAGAEVARRRRRGRAAPRRRRASAYAAELLGCAQRVLDAVGRVRQGAGAVRQADRQLPGGEAPLRRHARRRRGHALGRVLGGVVRRRRPSRRRRSRRRPPSRGAATPACACASRRSRCTAASASPGSTTSTST